MHFSRYAILLSLATSACVLNGCAVESTEAPEDQGAVEPAPETPEAPVEHVGTAAAALTSSQENSEWAAKLACTGACLLKSGADFGLQNQHTSQYLVYQERDYGINLGWTSNGSPAFHVVGQGGAGSTIKYGDKVALQPKGHSFIKYGSRRWGINLVWSDQAVYEWTVEGGAVGTEVTLNKPFGLKNAAVNDHVVYCTRPTGVNLRWSNDCYQVPGIGKRVPTTP